MKDVRKGKLNTTEIARKHKVSYHTANRHFECYIAEQKKTPPTKVGLGSKRQAYFTEDEMLSSPFYNAKNREKITPINPDWKLY